MGSINILKFSQKNEHFYKNFLLFLYFSVIQAPFFEITAAGYSQQYDPN